MIIGISGKANSGKNTVGDIIQYLISPEYKDGWGNFENWKEAMYAPTFKSKFEIKRFTDNLKDIVCLLIGCTREQLEDREFKEKELGEEWDFYQPEEFGFKGFVLDANITYDEKLHRGLVKQKMTQSLLMQLLETECGRQIIHPNIWVNSLFVDYTLRFNGKTFYADGIGRVVQQHEFPNWIIPDVRFPNEAKAIKDKGGIVIRVNRPKPGIIPSDNDFRPSETALDKYEDFDYVIENDGSIKDLVAKIKRVLQAEYPYEQY